MTKNSYILMRLKCLFVSFLCCKNNDVNGFVAIVRLKTE